MTTPNDRRARLERIVQGFHQASKADGQASENPAEQQPATTGKPAKPVRRVARNRRPTADSPARKLKSRRRSKSSAAVAERCTQATPDDEVPGDETAPSGLEGVLLRLVDAVIAVLIFGLPFIMGGRQAWGHLVLIGAALTGAAVWCAYAALAGRRWRFCGLEPLVLAGLALVWFQSQPTSQEMLSTLSPEYARLLPGWTANAGTAAAGEQPAVVGENWTTPSFMPAETWHGFQMAVAYALAFALLLQRCEHRSDRLRLLKCVGLSAGLMAAFGFVQFATSNNRFFWFYRHPYTGTSEVLKGAFTNRNHFAHFLMLGVGPLLWWITAGTQVPSRRRGRHGRPVSDGSLAEHRTRALQMGLILLATLVAGGVMVSLSRGGMVALGIVFAVSLVGLWKAGQITGLKVLAFPALMIAALGMLTVYGHDAVEGRVEELASGEADEIDQMNVRRTIWETDARAIERFPIVGTGVGTHRVVYPIYMKNFADFAAFEMTHAESSIVQLALECGFVGLGLVSVALLICGIRFLFRSLSGQGNESSAVTAVVGAALFAATLHAVADFVWYVPACVLSGLVLLAVGLRACESERRSMLNLPCPRIVWLLASVGCGYLAILWMPGLHARTIAEERWFAYVMSSHDARNSHRAESLDQADESRDAETTVRSAVAQSPQESAGGYAAASNTEDQLYQQQTARLTRHLNLLAASLKAVPHQPQVRFALAATCVELFNHLQERSESRMPLMQIRLAARSSGFASADEQRQWLKRAFGRSVMLLEIANDSIAASLKDCPIDGRIYLQMLEVDFLNDPTGSRSDAILNQAVVVRGNDPRTHYLAGRESLAFGHPETALEHWEIVFHASRDYRLAIAGLLAPSTHASGLIERFHPTSEELSDLLAVYARLNRPDDVQAVSRAMVSTVKAELDAPENQRSTEETIELLMTGYSAAYRLRETAAAEEFLARAIGVDPSSFWPRRAYGLHLYEAQRYDEALAQFQWCYERQSGDGKLEDLIKASRRLSITQRISPESASDRIRQVSATRDLLESP